VTPTALLLAEAAKSSDQSAILGSLPSSSPSTRSPQTAEAAVRRLATGRVAFGMADAMPAVRAGAAAAQSPT
jgi:hypothetical protein